MHADLKTVWNQFKAKPGAKEVFWYRSKMHEHYGCEWPDIKPDFNEDGKLSEWFENWFEDCSVKLCSHVIRTNPEQAERLIKNGCDRWAKANSVPPTTNLDFEKMFGYGKISQLKKKAFEMNPRWIELSDRLGRLNEGLKQGDIDMSDFKHQRGIIYNQLNKIELECEANKTDHKVTNRNWG